MPSPRRDQRNGFGLGFVCAVVREGDDEDDLEACVAFSKEKVCGARQPEKMCAKKKKEKMRNWPAPTRLREVSRTRKYVENVSEMQYKYRQQGITHFVAVILN